MMPTLRSQHSTSPIEPFCSLASAATTLLVVTLSVSGWAGGQVQRLKTAIHVVELDVVVLDEDRRPVRGLAREDFTVVENGRVRPIVGFAPVDLPATSDQTRASMDFNRGVVTNQVAERGRLVVIAFDRTIPAGPATVTAKSIARAAVDSLGPSDRAAVVRTSGFANEGRSQNFTSDRSLLYDAVDSAFTGLVSPPTMELRGLTAGPIDLRTSGDCPCGLCTLESLERIASALASARQFQKTILFIGTDLVVSDERGMTDLCRGRIRRVREQTLRALDRANVRVHSLDPAGLEPLTAGVSAVERRFSDVRATIQARQANLEVLPSFTGGRFIRNTNAPAESVRQIFGETAYYYLIGFEGGDSADDQQRTVRVQVSRRGLKVLTRRASYPAGSSQPVSATESLDDTVLGLLPVSDMPLRLSLTSIFTPSGGVRTNVMVGIPASLALGARNQVSVPLGARRDHSSEAKAGVELVLSVFDSGGREILAEHQDFPVSYERCANELCEAIFQVVLKPGRYEVRVGARDRASSRRGSVYGYVQVPDLKRDSFQMAPLLIGIETQSNASTVPSIRRSFGTDERLVIFTQLHRILDSRLPVICRVSIAGADATVVTKNVREIQEFSAAGISDIRIEQALSKFFPGAYTVAVEAAHGDRVLRREIAFDVR